MLPGPGPEAAASGAMAPTAKPLANAAPDFRNSRRAGRFQAIGLSLMSLREECVLAAEVYARRGRPLLYNWPQLVSARGHGSPAGFLSGY